MEKENGRYLVVCPVTGQWVVATERTGNGVILRMVYWGESKILGRLSMVADWGFRGENQVLSHSVLLQVLDNGLLMPRAETIVVRLVWTIRERGTTSPCSFHCAHTGLSWHWLVSVGFLDPQLLSQTELLYLIVGTVEFIFHSGCASSHGLRDNGKFYIHCYVLLLLLGIVTKHRFQESMDICKNWSSNCGRYTLIDREWPVFCPWKNCLIIKAAYSLEKWMQLPPNFS